MPLKFQPSSLMSLECHQSYLCRRRVVEVVEVKNKRPIPIMTSEREKREEARDGKEEGYGFP